MALLHVTGHVDRMGLDWIARWYVRNLAIYANLLQWTEPGDRWHVIFGDGHPPLLRHFVHDTMERKEG